MAGSSSNGNFEGEIFPYDVIIDILKRVPVKSLIRFTSVSKDWYNLIKTPHFITHHLHHSLQNPFLLLERFHRLDRFSLSISFCLIGPDLKVHNSQFLDFIPDHTTVAASCNGLLCFQHNDKSFSICNPATRQFRQVPQTLIDSDEIYRIGFGFSTIANDYKILRVSVAYDKIDGDDQVVLPDKVHVKRVEVYSLATGLWREIDASSLQNLTPTGNFIDVDGALFCKATINSESDSAFDNFLVSFDMDRQVFTLLKGPESSVEFFNEVLAVYNNKFAMFHRFVVGNFEGSMIDLWVLDNTDTFASEGERWIKQCRIGPFSRIIYPQRIWGDEVVCREELHMDMDEIGGRRLRVLKTVISLFNICSNEVRNLPSNRTESYYIPIDYAESLVQVPTIHLQQ